MEQLYSSERYIVNTLIDQGFFNGSITADTKRSQEEAISALQRPVTQRHINQFMQNMFAIKPQNFRGNLLFLLGEQQLPPEKVHILLATCKAVINAPEMQGVTSDRVIACSALVRLVNSEVTETDDKTIRKIINQIFVDRFQLFSIDRPLESQSDENVEIEEYWDVSPEFTSFVKCLVADLNADHSTEKLSDIQRINRYLLQHKYLSAKRFPYLWQILQQNKATIESDWHVLQRYYLECGNDYALLLDDYRKPSESRQFYTAIKVAQSLGAGLSQTEYHQRIKQIWHQLYPNVTCNLSLVKNMLNTSGLVREVSGLVMATPLAKRYVIQLIEEND